MLDATDSTLALSQDGRRVDLRRDRVLRVNVLGKRSVKRSALIGAAVGALVGLRSGGPSPLVYEKQ